MDNTTLADELERLSIAAEKTADDIRYYSGGSKHNKEAEALAELCSTNLPTILAALRTPAPSPVSVGGDVVAWMYTYPGAFPSVRMDRAPYETTWTETPLYAALQAQPTASTAQYPDAAVAVEPTLPPDLAKWVLEVGKVEWGATDPHDADGHADHIRTSVNLTAEHFQQAEPQQMHGLYIEGTGTVICHTGTSPNSPRTAQLLTGAWNWFHDAAIRAGGQL